ncbi:MAG: Imidazole glycerol phosphate synthase subunit HisH [Parcubacteria group bacterium GW2011_GWC1_43_12]|nr:MAG: Imidazole glycerol phosphate synthase subunit HisH [Parcubacteria group bacterium GW2011_GWB1_42_6]KKS92297.1 MAG: Imidazole glycerol phosphate synthase subunit HisH [Parcubacteria group bacterium GW2011_GWC1_43_12]
MGDKLCILDYGSGNVGSVFNMFSTIMDRVVVSNRPPDLISSTHIILPGVGAFGSAMEKIKKTIPLDVLEEEVLRKGKPFLGICVGMQVLADKGFEFGECKGLGWISGTVEKMESGDFSLPHVGWNNIEVSRQTKLFEGLSDNQDFYFVHSYVFKEKNSNDAAAKTDYGEKFTSVVARDNIFGVQFHPEKSQKAGRIILKNFLDIK